MQWVHRLSLASSLRSQRMIRPRTSKYGHSFTEAVCSRKAEDHCHEMLEDSSLLDGWSLPCADM
eukprot:1414514-Amphidinium_carterae.1